jgi:hypothetical protein
MNFCSSCSTEGSHSYVLQQEKQWSEARNIKRILTKVQGGAITRIEVLEEDVYVEKTDQGDVEHHMYNGDVSGASRAHTQNMPLRLELLCGARGPFAIAAAAADAM